MTEGTVTEKAEKCVRGGMYYVSLVALEVYTHRRFISILNDISDLFKMSNHV